MSALLHHLKKLARPVITFALPPVCGLCRRVVSEEVSLCPACWHKLHFIAPPFCGCCGTPLLSKAAHGSLCASCLTTPPLYSVARAAVDYDAPCRVLIGRFKYGDQMHLAKTFVQWMQRIGPEAIEGANLVVPVPLYRWRLFRRKYNQAALLAEEVAKQNNLAMSYTALTRIRSTSPQVGKKRAERLKNVRGAFVASSEVEGKTVLLIDDVYTTGATLDSCTQALLERGAQEVRVLSIARVIRPEHVEAA